MFYVNPSGFSYEKPPPFTKGRLCCGFLGLLFVAEIRCKQVVWQPLRRLTPPAPLAQWSQDVANLWECYFVFDIYLQIILIKMIFRCNKLSEQTAKFALLVQGRVVWAFSEHREGWLKIYKPIIFNKLGSFWYTCLITNQHFKQNELQGSLW